MKIKIKASKINDPMKYRLRKTDEPVEIVAWETTVKGARADTDWVSYIDANGVEHIMEHLTLEWDFIMDSPFEKIISGGFGGGLDKFDPWESRRYELAKEYALRGLASDNVNSAKAVAFADDIIEALKKAHPEAELSSTVTYDPKKGL